MPKILQLDQHVADLIAAGEVVERPASVVKELLENSIDAGASVLTVEISAGGMTYIRVTDNGCGIAPEDAKTAFLRHATSKLRDAGGLEAIGTLGFRGEALAAIAAVSRIELLTRRQGFDDGVRLTLEAGDTVDFTAAGCPEGTTIIVRDLFFNTPARQKFMKTDRAESSAIASAVLRCALSHPEVSIRFIKEGKTEYHTPGDSRVDSCIYSLLGRDFASGLIKAESLIEDVGVSGFISTPGAARGNRSYQFFFVNGRPIRGITLQAALEQAYANRLTSGQFPSCVLYITLNPASVDVNVHPAKTEVKFVSDKDIYHSIYYAALGALEREAESGGGGGGVGGGAGGGFRSMQVEEYRRKYNPGSSDALKSNDNNQRNSIDSRASTDCGAVHGGSQRRDGSVDHRLQYSQLSFSDSRFSTSDSQPSTMHPPIDLQSGEKSLAAINIRVIGEALNTYIVAEHGGSVWFIDKHAAHERIHFDVLRSGGFEPMSQTLISPVVCRLGHEGASLMLESAGLMDKLGFSVESFGEDSIAVRRIPADIDIGDTEPVLSEICVELARGGASEQARLDGVFSSIACKAAIKAGKASGMRELEALAQRVFSGEVTHCPHGRPVAYELTKAALDKSFKRG